MSVTIGAFDRSNEFRACVQFFQQQVLSGRIQLQSRHSHAINPKSEPSSFMSNAKSFLVELSLTRTKYHKLVLLLEIPEPSALPSETHKLIDIIRCDLIDLNKSISHLKDIHTQVQSKLSRQISKHNRLLVTCLEFHLSDLVKAFRTVLERNAEILSNSQDTGQECTSSHSTTSTAFSTSQPTVASFQPNTHKHTHSSVTLDYGSTPTQAVVPPVVSYPSIANANPPNWSQQVNTDSKSPTAVHTGAWHRSTEPSTAKFYIAPQSANSIRTFEQPLAVQTDQLQLHAPPDQHLRQRDANIKRVESTIIQLGEIYQQFSYLVKEQSDVVGRIDSYTEETDFNVSSAHEQILLYLRTISSRRSLMIKIFVTLLVGFVLFSWLKR